MTRRSSCFVRELRNPPGTILGSAQLMQTRRSLPPQRAAWKEGKLAKHPDPRSRVLVVAIAIVIAVALERREVDGLPHPQVAERIGWTSEVYRQ